MNLVRFTLEQNVEEMYYLVNPRCFAAGLKGRCCTGWPLPEFAPHPFGPGTNPDLPRL